MIALRGFFMTTVNSMFQEKSTELDGGYGVHSNSCTILASIRWTWTVAIPIPGQIRRPTPNGIILTPVTPVMSASSSPEKNLSGSKFSGFFHSFGSAPMAGKKISTFASFGIS